MALELKTKGSLAEAARTLAASYELVQHGSTLYLPMDFETGVSEPLPSSDRRIWAPMTRQDVQRFAAAKSNILFANESEIVNFELQLKQLARLHDNQPDSTFIRTTEGLRILDTDGKLVEPDGRFRPNCLTPVLNEDQEEKDRVFGVIQGWLNSEAEAHSLLHHLATALAPGWSAVKYVILLGEGRNGKSVLLYMLSDLFGLHNVSAVSRQEMAERSPVCADLNGKLLNIVMDGSMTYVKDSGMEKTLIAGEAGAVRKLYESSLTQVQTNALFLEALNAEPKTRDKSSALQKRLVRYRFPNVYPLSPQFSQAMRTEKSLGAFLSLLIDHYVRADEAAVKLAPTEMAKDLQLDQMLLNSIALQYIEYLVLDDPNIKDRFIGMDLANVVASFIPWAQSQEGQIYSNADAVRLFQTVFRTKRTRQRNKKPANYYKIESLSPEVEHLIEIWT